MNNPNYSRKMLAQIEAMGIEPLSVDVCGKAKTGPVDWYGYFATVLPTAVKFSLPPNGVNAWDASLRGFDEGDRLHLPFPNIALEYVAAGVSSADQSEPAPKRIISAQELDLPDYPHLVAVAIAFYSERVGLWMPQPPVSIDVANFLGPKRSDGSQGIIWRKSPASKMLPDSDYSDIGVLMQFLNMLQCNNVEVERIPATKKPTKRNPLPFDDYHVLTIPSSHGGTGEGSEREGRSPREHLRRGHVRRLPSGAKTWVKATVVNPGHAKASKSYKVVA